MLRRLARTCLLLTLPAMGCQQPPAAQPPPTPPADPGTAEQPKPLPPADEVLAKSVEAIGGQAAIEAITSSYSETRAEIKAQGISMVTKSWTKGEMAYTEADLPGMGLQQLWKKGDEVWAKDPVFGMRKLEGKEAEQNKWLSEGPLLAAKWKEHFDKAESTGWAQNGDTEVVEVTLSREGGDAPVVLQFDAERYLLVGMAFEQQSPMGAVPLRTTQSDFREIEGVLIPFRSVTEVQLTTMETVTEKYEVNIEIPDDKFTPPEPGAPADPAKDDPGAEPAKDDPGAKKGKPAKKGKSAKKGKPAKKSK